MKITRIGETARKWVEERAGNMPGLLGAYLSGSYPSAPAGADWPESSDVDIVLVFRRGACPPKIGKTRAEGVLLEISCLEEGEFAELTHVLSTHYLAYALNAGGILFDPSGMLTRLHEEVRREYGERRWVEARCQWFYRRIEQGVEGYVPGNMTFPQAVNGWAFTTGITCFPILLADLRNCTVRKRYTAARGVLESYGLGDFYPRLLSLLVPAPLGRERLAGHMKELEKTFALASGTRGPSAGYAFRSDISEEGAAVAIGGSWELIEGEHPEDAAFWMLVTFARCHIILDMDEPGLSAERLPALRGFLRELGVSGEEDIAERLRAVRGFLPGLKETVEDILCKRG